MNLSAFQAERGLTLTQLASLLGKPVTTVHGWINGHRLPSWRAMLEIERATGGKVSLADFRGHAIARDKARRAVS